MSAKHTFGQDLGDEASSYHADIIRNQLTRSLPVVFEDICDEISLAMNDVVPRPEKEGGTCFSVICGLI